jgi:hypothetical protein
MNSACRISRLERRTAGQPTGDHPQGDELAAIRNAPDDEARDLARETAAAFGQMVSHYREYWKLSADEAIARADEPSAALVEHALNAPPDQVDWHAIEAIARQDPAAALRRWLAVKDAARGELRAGGRAAEALQS